MTRFFRRWIPALLLAAFVVAVGLAQGQTDEEKKRAAFLKSKQSESDSGDESPTPKPKKAKTSAHKSPTPHAHASASVKPKAHKKAEDNDEPTPAKKKTSSEASPPHKAKAGRGAGSKASHEPTPHKKKTGAAAKSEKAKSAAKKKDEDEPVKNAIPASSPSETPAVNAESTAPHAAALPAPAPPRTQGAVPRPTSSYYNPSYSAGGASSPNEAPGNEPEMTIEKSGYEKHGFWYRVFHGNSSGRSSGYRFLTASVKAEIDRAPADRRNPQWQFIIVHNSGTRQGNARVFDYYHRHVRHMQNGLAYHFVIGNGTSTGNGQIEVGDRWRRQINGGHVHSDNLNNIALGICLVGDFNRTQPTPAQLQSCEELIRYLRQRCGKIGNRYMLVKPHREVNPPRWATDCPGDAFPYSWFRRF